LRNSHPGDEDHDIGPNLRTLDADEMPSANRIESGRVYFFVLSRSYLLRLIAATRPDSRKNRFSDRTSFHSLATDLC
jgi:hypothetical protein